MSSLEPEGRSPVERELDILTSDYEATRDDQRQAYSRQAAVLSAGIAVFAAFYYLTAENQNYLKERPLLALALPLAPFLIAQTYIWYEIDTVLRGYYVRALEKAIQERLAVPSALGPNVNFPSIGYLSYIVAAPRHYGWQVFALNIFGWIAVVILFGGSALLAILSVPNVVDRIYAIAVYSFMAALLIQVARQTLFRRARTYFTRVFSKYPSVFDEPIDQVLSASLGATKERFQYLLIPRLAELVKWGTFLLAWAVSLALALVSQLGSTTTLAFSLVMAGIYLVVFEFLMYQARYQWNDLRGAEYELGHVSREGRRRLPPGCERLSFAVMLIRVFTALYIIDLAFRNGSDILTLTSSSEVLGTNTHLIVYVIAVLPFLIAIPYELLRETSDREVVRNRFGLWLIRAAIYLLVGIGFAVRVVMGVLIGAPLSVSWDVVATLFVAASLAGSAETLAIWGLEAKATEIAADGGRARPDTAPLTKYVDRLLRANGTGTEGNIDSFRVNQIRLSRDVLRSPWAALHLASIVMASIFGIKLAHIQSALIPHAGAISVLFVLTWLVVGVACIHMRASTAVIFVITYTFICCIIGWVMLGHRAATAPIAVAILVLIHLFDRMNSHNDFVLGAWPLIQKSMRIAADVFRFSAQLLFGKHSAREVFGRFGEARRPPG